MAGPDPTGTTFLVRSTPQKEELSTPLELKTQSLDDEEHMRSAINKLCMLKMQLKDGISFCSIFMLEPVYCRTMTVAEGQRPLNDVLKNHLRILIEQKPSTHRATMQVMCMDDDVTPTDIISESGNVNSGKFMFGVSGGGHAFAALTAAMERKPGLKQHDNLKHLDTTV